MPPSFGGIKFTATYELVPTPTGTILSFRVARPKKVSDQKSLEVYGPHLAAGVLDGPGGAEAETTEEVERSIGDRVEPALPQSKNTDGFLEAVQHDRVRRLA